MIDISKDKRLADEWEKAINEDSMTAEEISFLASTGLQTCEGYCPSRNHTGEDRCACIRERFPTPTHYQLYLSARSKYLKLFGLGLLANAVSVETNGEPNANRIPKNESS